MKNFITEVLKVIYDAEMHSDLYWSFEGEKINFSIGCSDVFWWGTADGEELTPENLEILKDSIKDVNAATGDDYASYAAELFCSRIRKMRPQGAAYPSDKRLWPLFDECGEYREPGFGNPKDHPSKRNN